ncbi:MAG TPA: hypothetical protein VNL16_18245 [Chloroflexota bacterium]|nr:hypothetical protein [Chloroflexota bacterium]
MQVSSRSQSRGAIHDAPAGATRDKRFAEYMEGDPMRNRILGKSGLEVSAIRLGR